MIRIKKENKFNLNIVKFLSYIFDPKKYPINKKTIENKIELQFKDQNISQEIINSLVWSKENYWIEPQGLILSPDNVSEAIYETLLEWENPNNIWVLSILYTKQNHQEELSKNLIKNNTSDNEEKILDCFKNAFKTLKPENYLSKSNDSKRFDFSYLIKSNHLSTYKDLRRGFIHPYFNSCLKEILITFCQFNKIEWNQVISAMDNPLPIYIYNYYYQLLNKDTTNDTFYLDKITFESSNDIIALAYLNTFALTNKKIIKESLIKLDLLPENKRYYWLGVLLSNIEYILCKELVEEFEKNAQKKIIQLLLASNNQNDAVEEMIKGLKAAPRKSGIRHFKVFEEINKENEKLACLLAEKVLEDYKVKLKNKDNFYNTFNDSRNVDYTNTVIHSIGFLATIDKVNVKVLFTDMLSEFNISKEDCEDNSSEVINTKNAVLNIFTVLFFVIEVLQKNNKTLDKTGLDLFFKCFLNYINMNTDFKDDIVSGCIENVFKLGISKERDLIKKEIDFLFDLPIPNFELLSILMPIANNKEDIIHIIEFINNYFDKYNHYWDRYKFQYWFNVWCRLKDRQRAEICFNNLPKYQQNELRDKLATI